MGIWKRRCVLSCALLTLMVCVMAQAAAAPGEGRLLDQLELPSSRQYTIAIDVCYLLLIDTDPSECEENFMNPPEDVGPPAELTIKGQFQNKALYQISPSDVSQAVVVMSDDGDVMVNAIPPKLDQDSTYVNSTKNYTFWTAAVTGQGIRSQWLQGPTLLAWDIVAEHNEYIIQIEVKYGNSSVAEVDFIWNSSSDQADQFFTVTNDCNNTPFLERTVEIKAGENGTLSVMVPLGAECRFSVQGLYGSATKEYALEPRPARDIAVVAREARGGWSVRVRWARPARAPDRYEVVLRADTERALNVSGDATEVTFRGVTGQKLYNVSVIAYVGPMRAHALVHAFFPTKQASSSSVPVLSSVLALLLLAAALAGAAVWCRRRRHSKLSLFDESQEDPCEFLAKFAPEGEAEDRWELRPERLALHEVVGEGAFGVVRRGTLAPAQPVAVKMLKDYPTRDEVRSFRAEMELMKSVGAHAHVVSLVGCCSGRRPLIVAEFCARGDLLSYLRCSWDIMVSKRNAKYHNNNSLTSNYRNDLFKSIPQEESKLVVNKMYDLNGVCDSELTYVDLLSFCRQIAMGMEFLASNRVVHRDLAARNVLVTSDRTLKIADFGLSRDIYQENQYKQKGNGKMPVKWMALESLTHRIYTTQSDVWSFGVVAWEAVTLGGAPYADVPPARLPRLLRSGYRMPQPAACCRQLYELMLACWRERPRDRPTFAELHAELDALLHAACAGQYLALDLDGRPEEPRPKYARLLELARGKHRRALAPLRTPSNHYSSPPAPAPCG